MATRTQLRIEADGNPSCIHEQVCQVLYEQQRRRIQSLCQWMATDLTNARRLAFMVFVEAWRQPGGNFPAVSGDRLAERFASRFRGLFHDDCAPSLPRETTGPRLVKPAKSDAAPEPVRDAVTALPSAHRLLYLLHELEGYSAATLAAWLDLEPSRCSRMIHEARAQLRRNLLPV